MSYQIEHLNTNGLLIRTGETLSAADLAEINLQISMASRQVKGSINIIFDLMATTTSPHDEYMLRKSMKWASEPNLGWIIYLTKNPALSISIGTAMMSYDQTYMVLDSLKSAMTIIAMPAA